MTPDRLRWLLQNFQLEETPRTEGPGSAASIAHRSFTDPESGTRLVLDLSRINEAGWVFALFHDGERPSDAAVAQYRTLFRDAIARLELDLVEITPAVTADEVFVPAPSGTTEVASGAHWPLPYEDLERVWSHLGLRANAPREVKEVRLRELMATPAWSDAPEALRHQATEFLRGS
ncbi:hypothetical protein [Streptomyces sp. AP-93]|uniref:hypothetical protein n=1 Tax=Streptomyces sp. AP-93 TaxID=2929048 RepID=UPI001FAFA3EA|nr:hypothetical protein [Streptomyces sp. AP-93]MCJ0875807.1 hypothetical protein [Streptomyces sp. AP-93]